MPFDQIIGVVAVQHSLMPAIRPMNVVRFMSAALMIRCAAVFVHVARFEFVFVGMIPMDMVQMALVEVIGVAVMFHRGVAAIRAVHMRMPVLFHASFCHDFSFASRALGKQFERNKELV